MQRLVGIGEFKKKIQKLTEFTDKRKFIQTAVFCPLMTKVMVKDHAMIILTEVCWGKVVECYLSWKSDDNTMKDKVHLDF